MGKSEVTSEPSVAFARNVDWNLLKVFLEIGRRGGIGAAARALNKKQPSITAALRRLEDQVGVKLCTRTPRGVELTIQGQQLLATCESMQASVRNIPRAISSSRADISGTVTLRVLSNLYNLDKLSGIFDDFHTRYPRVEVSLDVATWREILHSLKKGEIELGIGFAEDLDDRFLRVPIMDQLQQIYCGPKHRFFGKPPVKPSLMEAEPFVVTRDELPSYIRYRHRHGLGRRIGAFADSLNERMWLIRLGMGIGFLPKPVVDNSDFCSELWPLLSNDEAPICPLYLMANGQAARSAPAQLLLDTALSHLQDASAGHRSRC